MGFSINGLRAPICLGCLALTTAGTSSLLGVAAAQAATVTVGSPLTQTFGSEVFNQPLTILNSSLPEAGANVNAPISGILVRWRVVDAQGGPFTLHVLQPKSGTTYLGVGETSPEMGAGIGTQTFSADLPIQSGDLIALQNSAKGDRVGFAAPSGAQWSYFTPPLNVGASGNLLTGEKGEIGFNADVQPPPGLSTIAPASGSISGGTTVVISGRDLTGATGVKFGAIPVASFTVNSETQITALAPSTAAPGTVDVTATTLAGTTPVVATDKFTYTACIVPKVKDKTLKATRKKLTAAGCTLGKVKGKKTKRAKIRKQGPKAGAILGAGAPVNVRLSG